MRDRIEVEILKIKVTAEVESLKEQNSPEWWSGFEQGWALCHDVYGKFRNLAATKGEVIALQ